MVEENPEDFPARHLRPSKRRKKKRYLPKLNIKPRWRIGEPKPNIRPDPLAESAGPWEQKREPFPEGRSVEDSLGLFYVERKRKFYLRKKKQGDRVGTVL